MKIFGITLIVLFAMAFFAFFYDSARIARETISMLQTTSTAVTSALSIQKLNAPTTTVPAGLHGPTTGPTMRGPTGPPPDY